MRDKALDAHFTGVYLAQCAARERFKPANEYVESIPTLTDNADAPTREDGDYAVGTTRPLSAETSAPIPERDVLKAVLGVCEAHPRVAWAERMNSGMMKKGSHYVRFGFKGCADVIGQLRDGRFLAIETKRLGKDGTKEQLEFLGKVSRAGGLAFVAWSAADAVRGLDELEAA